MKTLNIILLILFPLRCITAQVLQYESDKLYYSTSDMDKYIVDYKKFEDFPIHIQKIVTDLLKNQLGSNFNKLTFEYGYGLQLEDYFNDFPKNINKYNTIVPHYIFHFNWSDPTVGISKYTFRLGIDNIGQIIYLDFPHSYNFKSYDFMTLDGAVKIADSITIIEQYHFDHNGYYLSYDNLRNDLIWNIYYSHTDTIENKYYKNDHLNFDISTRSHKLLRFYYDTSNLILPIQEIGEEEIVPLKKRKN